MKARINVKTLRGEFLTYTVNTWSDSNGKLSFFDEKTKQYKIYPSTNCEITFLEGNPWENEQVKEDIEKLSHIPEEELKILQYEAEEEMRGLENEQKKKQ